MEERRHIGGTLHVWLSSQGIDASSGLAGVAQEELEHGIACNQSGTTGVLGETHGIKESARSVFSDGLGDFQEFILGNTRYLGYSIPIVAGIMLFELGEDTIRVINARRLQGLAVGTELIGPGCHVIFSFRLIITGKYPILE